MRGMCDADDDGVGFGGRGGAVDNNAALFRLGAEAGVQFLQAIQGGAASAGRIVVEHFSDGILGLTLPEPEEPEDTPITGTDAADMLVGGADDDRFYGERGNCSRR